MKFTDMGIDSRVLKAMHEMKLHEPTEIQQKAMPAAIAGQDVIGKSMTGSGKTLVFAVPIIQKLRHGEGIQALVVCPTRELVLQTAGYIKKLAVHAETSVCEVYGGVSLEEQVRKLSRTDVVVGTPGRILDHVRRRTVNFRNLKIFVLDEADRMLDMGFIDDIRMIFRSVPEKRQTMLFSATIPERIYHITRMYMKNPVTISTQALVSRHKLAQFYCNVRHDEKLALLVHLVKKEKPRLAIIFCSTRSMSDVVGDVLAANDIDAKTLHGGLTQNRRTNLMEGFHRGRPHVLVATDVAARGLDIKDISHIFNFDVPRNPEDYIHRIGRTARIGKEGKAITLLSKIDHDAFRKIVRNTDIEPMEEKDFPIKINHPARRFSRETGFREGESHFRRRRWNRR